MASTTQTYVISNRTRKEWRGGTEKIVISEKSLNPWNYCQICQHPAVHPYCCPKGDVFCKECIINFMLMNKPIKEKKEKKDKSKEKDIEKFLNLQRVIPQELKHSESIERSIKEKKNKVCCPVCNSKIKLNKLHMLIFDCDNDNPMCSSCKKIINGSIYAKRLSCCHIVCNDCYSEIVEKLEQCPKCSASINLENTIILNKTIHDIKKPGGQIIITHADLVDSFG